ncbi:hypothetical protein SDC9_67470 [bioreactor metagenome]|uniref:Uncharacterized protein n=1 Tax=bioreactor metagenome TaxID=1076179 RepID=A0A644XZE3_9ZZZZ
MPKFVEDVKKGETCNAEVHMQRFVVGKYLQPSACRLFVNNINLR